MIEHKALLALTPIAPDQLDRLAQEGWLLICILTWQGEFLFYFRRETGGD